MVQQVFEQYKTDKLIDYFRFLFVTHMAIIGAIFTFKEKILGGSLDFVFFFTISLLFISCLIVVLGYSSLAQCIVLRESESMRRNRLKWVEFAVKYSGPALAGVVISFFIKAL